MKHDLKANIQEEIANIPADKLVRVMASPRNRFIQCMDNGRRHLPDVMFKTVLNKTLYVYHHYEPKLKVVLLPFEKGGYVAAPCTSFYTVLYIVTILLVLTR